MQAMDIVIHVNENLDPGEQEALESELRKIEGVVAPRFNQKHLLLVSYNSDRTSSSELLGAVSSKGYKAQLVGM